MFIFGIKSCFPLFSLAFQEYPFSFNLENRYKMWVKEEYCQYVSLYNYFIVQQLKKKKECILPAREKSSVKVSTNLLSSLKM